jgi:hypothetical protein
MNPTEIPPRLRRLRELHDGFLADHQRWHRDLRPDVVIYALALDQAAVQLVRAIEALERLQREKGVRVR